MLWERYAPSPQPWDFISIITLSERCVSSLHVDVTRTCAGGGAARCHQETDHVGITKANELGIDPRYLVGRLSPGPHCPPRAGHSPVTHPIHPIHPIHPSIHPSIGRGGANGVEDGEGTEGLPRHHPPRGGDSCPLGLPRYATLTYIYFYLCIYYFITCSTHIRSFLTTHTTPRHHGGPRVRQSGASRQLSPSWTSSRTCGPMSRPGPTTPYALPPLIIICYLFIVAHYLFVFLLIPNGCHTGRHDHQRRCWARRR
jgi:hypothetical protein